MFILIRFPKICVLDKQIGRLHREYILPLRYVPVPISPPIDVDTELDPSELKH